jgi:ribonuclease HII
MDLHEKEAYGKGFCLIAGVDEAGRGPLAGPVVSAAVIFLKPPLHMGLRDSKVLSPPKRVRLFFDIYREAASVGVGIAWPEEIDRINIHLASLVSMKRAVEALSLRPDFILIDGRFPLELPIGQKTIVCGDSKSVTIAAASIVAKVTRDFIMCGYHNLYPQYNFVENKGYPTAGHYRALSTLGPTTIHRKSFNLCSVKS